MHGLCRNADGSGVWNVVPASTPSPPPQPPAPPGFVGFYPRNTLTATEQCALVEMPTIINGQSRREESTADSLRVGQRVDRTPR